MKTVIVSLTSQYVHSALAPWYLYYSAKAECDLGTELSVLEGTVNEEEEDIYARIKAQNADLVAFSCYIWNISLVLRLAETLKGEGKKILLGGPEVSYRAEELFDNKPFIDYIICGEGERPFVQLLNALIRGKTPSNISGLCYKKGDKIHLSPPHSASDTPISPYGEEYLSALKGRIAYLETSRGCPFSCAFCLSGRLGGVRFFPLERAKADIITLANSGSKIIKLVDRTFNANPQRAYELFDFIIKNHGGLIPKGVCFHFEIAGDLLREEDLTLLKGAPRGAIQLEIGIQSLNAATLKAVNRKTDTQRLCKNISALCKNKNIHIHIDLIAGLPLEDMPSFRESFNLAFGLNADMLQLGFLKLLYGAEMREKRDKYPLSFSCEPPYEVISTPWLSSRETELLRYTENALDRFVCSGRFKNTAELIFGDKARNPFDTLTELGMFTGRQSCSLNDYVAKLYAFFGQYGDKAPLRDALLCDLSTSVKSATLPPCLAVKDKRLREFKAYLEENEATARKKGVMRSVFLLYDKGRGAYVDYDEKQDGAYKLNITDYRL